MEIGLVLIILTLVALLVLARMQSKQKKRMYEKYQAAIASGDQVEALRLGQEYYRYVRNAPLTFDDERAIASDLREMK